MGWAKQADAMDLRQEPDCPDDDYWGTGHLFATRVIETKLSMERRELERMESRGEPAEHDLGGEG